MKAYRCYVVFIDGMAGFAGALYEKRERAQQEVDEQYARHPEFTIAMRAQEQAIRDQLGEEGYRKRLEDISSRPALTGSGFAMWEVREEEVPRDHRLTNSICRICCVILGDDEQYTDLEAPKKTKRKVPRD